MDTGIIGVDAAGSITSWSAGACAILGWAVSDMIGRQLATTLKRASAGDDPACWLQSAALHGRVTVEGWQVRADGTLIWAICEAVPMRNGTGQADGFVVVVRDGTAQHALAEQQRADAEFLRSVLASSQDCIKVLTLDARIVFMNDGGLRIMDVGNVNEVCGRVWPDLWQGDGQPAAWSAVEAARAGEAARFQGWADTFKGSPRYWDVQVTPILDGNQRPERLLVVSRDVTEGQEDRRRLIASEERLGLALGASEVVGIWDSDLRTGTVYGEANFARFHGLDPAAVEAGVPMAEVFSRLHPADLPRLQAQISTLLDGGDSFDIEHRLAKPDGTWRWIAARGRVVRDADGVALRLPGAVVDVTERRQAEERQQLLMQELSHRIKNTLAVVHSLARQTLRGDGAIAAGREAFVSRLVALSAAHDVLLKGDWTGAALRDLVEATAHVYTADAHTALVYPDQIHPAEICPTHANAASSETRFRICGPPVMLGSQSALSFALVLSEMGTNAAKYGSLSVPHGSVEIDWRLEGEPGEQHLHFVWKETGGPPVSEPARRGFGSTLIERSLSSERDVQVTLSYEPDGARLTVAAPLSAVQSA